MISATTASYMQPINPPSSQLAEKTSVQVENNDAKAENSRSAGQLTPEEKAQVEKLKKTDQEVRAHEQAHKNAGGRYAGSASFGYQVGPDGRRYAVSGEVPIDIAPVDGDPQATITKMTVIAAAALAPAEPSGQDRRVAAQAASLRTEAQAELAVQSRNKLSGNDKQEDEKPNSFTLSALASYETGSFSADTEKPSGNILDLLS